MHDPSGHDHRYAIDARKSEGKLGWKSAETLKSTIRKTLEWHLSNPKHVQSGSYREWVPKQYERAIA